MIGTYILLCMQCRYNAVDDEADDDNSRLDESLFDLNIVCYGLGLCRSIKLKNIYKRKQ